MIVYTLVAPPHWDRIHNGRRLMTLELLLVYFCYGLSFFGMGLAVLLETGRSTTAVQARTLSFLAAFGIIHGTHEWLEAYLLQAHSAAASLPAWLDWLRLGLLISSFGCLLTYASLSLRNISPRYGKRSWHYALLGLWALAVLWSTYRTYGGFPVPWPGLVDALARYILAVPAASLAALALRADAAAALSESRQPVAKNLRLGALGFAVYALTQVFVHPIQVFPASILNQESFLAAIGLPIQVVRAGMATLITIGLLKALQAMEQERKSELAAAHQARVTALEQRDALRRDLLGHVVRSQEDERARIARELHDETAQLLSAFSLELGALRTKLRRADTTQMVDHLQDLSRQMSQGLYHLVRDLRPSHLDNLGLVPALNYLFSQDFRPKGLDVTFNVTGRPQRMDGLVETVLFRVAQESLSNVIRHAQVNEASVDLLYDCDQVSIRIRDAGRGFSPSQRFHPPRGWGLAGMRERVESLAGELRLKSAPGQGTVVEAVIPLDADHQKETPHGTDHAVAGG